jgi:hypothetical protein
MITVTYSVILVLYLTTFSTIKKKPLNLLSRFSDCLNKEFIGRWGGAGVGWGGGGAGMGWGWGGGRVGVGVEGGKGSFLPKRFFLLFCVGIHKPSYDFLSSG